MYVYLDYDTKHDTRAKFDRSVYPMVAMINLIDCIRVFIFLKLWKGM